MQVSPGDPKATAEKLSSFLRYCVTHSDGEFLEAVSEEDLTLGQLKALSLLADAPRQLSVKELAETLGISLPSASRAIDPLVRRKLVAREEDESDRRVKRLELTASGRKLTDRLLATRVSAFTTMLGNFTELERTKLEQSLDTILARPEFKGMGKSTCVTRLHAITARNRKWWTLGAMSFALFMIMLDNTVVNVALPSIQKDLDASLSALEWTINAYTLTFAVLLVTGGRLGDIFGRRRWFLIGVALFAGSSATAGLAPTDLSLVISRAVQGIGAALMMPATLSIITNAFPAEERGKAIGTWAGVSALALAIGPVVGGFLTEQVSWRAIFFLNIPVAVLAIIVTLSAVTESRDKTVARSVDYLGVGTLTIGLTALVLALVEGNSWGWDSTGIFALLAACVIGLVSFVLVELRVKNPMVQFEFFRNRTFVGTNAIAFIVSFAMLAMFFFMALYMQNILQYSPLEAGVRFLPATLVIMVTAPLAGRLTDRIGAKLPIAAGMTLVAIALFIQSQITVNTGYEQLLPSFILMGFGMGLVMSPMSTAAMNSVEVTKAGVASGILSMSRMVGGTFGVAAVGALFQRLTDERLGSALANTNLTAQQKAWFADNLGSGDVQSRLDQLDPATAKQVGAAMKDTFVYALSTSMKLSTAVAAVGVVIALLVIGGKPASVKSTDPAATAANPVEV